jgi:nucleotide-binding universal stress UspA family protein
VKRAATHIRTANHRIAAGQVVDDTHPVVLRRPDLFGDATDDATDLDPAVADDLAAPAPDLADRLEEHTVDVLRDAADAAGAKVTSRTRKREVIDALVEQADPPPS